MQSSEASATHVQLRTLWVATHTMPAESGRHGCANHRARCSWPPTLHTTAAVSPHSGGWHLLKRHSSVPLRKMLPGSPARAPTIHIWVSTSGWTGGCSHLEAVVKSGPSLTTPPYNTRNLHHLTTTPCGCQSRPGSSAAAAPNSPCLSHPHSCCITCDQNHHRRSAEHPHPAHHNTLQMPVKHQHLDPHPPYTHPASSTSVSAT